MNDGAWDEGMRALHDHWNRALGGRHYDRADKRDWQAIERAYVLEMKRRQDAKMGVVDLTKMNPYEREKILAEMREGMNDRPGGLVMP